MNEATITRYKLDQISDLNREECIEALQLLNYLHRRADEAAQKELNSYIDQLNDRVANMQFPASE